MCCTAETEARRSRRAGVGREHPIREAVDGTVRFLEGLGLRVTVGQHALDTLGYLAGIGADRLADVNDALRDPVITAIIATRGGKGAYRIAEQLAFAAAARYPKLLIGFSEVSVLNLALWKHCRLPGVHGARSSSPEPAPSRRDRSSTPYSPPVT
ncbi:hypothetical protein Vau01_122420 [Virgisporangium aurantiacum]|uniref:LD-carboxypeptidase N-terminal domain-containing protein n=1 Tax=Virgisporangium aurantiacum TaxID=175570 RepID=A0A8J3ZJ30_9ACTN|nr:hypothetical protein Vau01_122420 [Virgisporangium aurantiacum]